MELNAILTEQCGLTKDIQHPILLGLSGGPDSMCLCELLKKNGFFIVAAHFDHGLRPTSAEEADKVRKYVEGRGIPFILSREDIKAYAEREKLSIEEAARSRRYEFLFNEARRVDAQAVAVAHNADDQAETILMHILRGTGLTGLRGMPFKTFLQEWDARIPVVRPLLNVWRSEIMTYCEENLLTPIFDESNLDTQFFRNRLRNELIPELKTYNSQIKSALWRIGKTIEGDVETINQASDEAWKCCCRVATQDYVLFDASHFSQLGVGLQRNLIRRAISLFHPGLRDVDYHVIERGVGAVKNPIQRAPIDLIANLVMVVERGDILITKKNFQLKNKEWPQLEKDTFRQISIPGITMICDGWKVKAAVMDVPAVSEDWFENPDPFQVRLDAEMLFGPISLRSRQAGDRFDPLGMDGHQMKLSDYFINEKLPHNARDSWPLILCGERVVWIPGMRSAHFCRITSRTRKILHMQIFSIK